MTDRLTLAIPIDVARHFDSTVTQTQIANDTFQNSGDDVDLIESMIEDAEDEWRARTDDSMRISRVGVAGQRETYEEVTYKISGHRRFKRNYTGVTSDYLPEEVTKSLANDRVLPFDSAQGDELYIYRGLSGSSVAPGNTWEDITDEEGESWAIIDHTTGQLVFDPTLLYETQLTNQNGISLGGNGELSHLRVAISYRYGGLGGERGRATATDLDETGGIDSSETSTVDVTDGSGFPVGNDGGTITVLVGDEYMRVLPDPANDQMTIVERGVRGTTGASHSQGARIQYTPPAVRKAVAARAGMQLITAGRYSEWLPDAEDTIDKGEMQDSLEAIWEGTLAAMSA